MSLDSDLVGVIIACTVVAVCICVVVVLSSCVLYRRLETKRRKSEKRRSLAWAMYQQPALIPAGAANGGGGEHSNKIMEYRPRILSPNSPRGTPMYNSISSRAGEGGEAVRASPSGVPPGHQVMMRGNVSSSSTPRHSTNQKKANGHVMLPISLAQHPYHLMVNDAPDFYDARVTAAQVSGLPPLAQNGGELVQTEIYPDVPYELAERQQQIDKGSKPNRESQTDVYISERPDQPADESLPSPRRQSGSEDGIGSSTKVTIEYQSQNDLSNPNNNLGTDHDESNASNSNYKVIKKHHQGHVKMPDWLVKDYEEMESSIEVEGEDVTAITANRGGEVSIPRGNNVPGMVSVMVGDYSLTNGQAASTAQKEPTNPNVATTSWSSTVDDSSANITRDYSSTNYTKDFTILDYADPPESTVAASTSNKIANNHPAHQPSPPPPPPPPPAPAPAPAPEPQQSEQPQYRRQQVPPSRDANGSSNDKDDSEADIETAIRENKAAMLKQIRDKVNESAERNNPVFTSTPRVETEEAAGIDQEGEDESGSRRQRAVNDGSLDTLPPVGDTRL